MHCIGNSFVRTWKIHPLQACACVFSLEILPAGAVKGLWSLDNSLSHCSLKIQIPPTKQATKTR